MKINNVELEDIDIFDIEVAEKCEIAIAKVEADAKETDELSISQAIRKQCTSVFDCFNTIFGVGTDKKIFGTKVNLMICLKAFEELVLELNSKGKEIQELANKYSPNRAQRRTKK